MLRLSKRARLALIYQVMADVVILRQVVRGASYIDPVAILDGMPTERIQTMEYLGQVDDEDRRSKGGLFVTPPRTGLQSSTMVGPLRSSIVGEDGKKAIAGAYVDSFGVLRYQYIGPTPFQECSGVIFPTFIRVSLPSSFIAQWGVVYYLHGASSYIYEFNSCLFNVSQAPGGELIETHRILWRLSLSSRVHCSIAGVSDDR